MTTIEALQACRVYRAEVYVKAATRLAEAVASDPAGSHLDRYEACRTAWNVLCAVDSRIRAFVFAGDPIDDYYRLQEVPSAAGQSYADKVNEPLSDATVAALNAELASGNYARYRKGRP